MISNILRQMGLCERFSCSFKEIIVNLLAENPRDPFLELVLPRCENYQEKFIKKSQRNAYLPELAIQVKEIKEKSLERLDDLVRASCDSIEDNRGHCYTAKDSEEAREIISDIVGRGKAVVKSLSPALEEIEIGYHLEKSDNDVCDVGLGSILVDYILRFSQRGKINVGKITSRLEQLIGEPIDVSEESVILSINRYLRRRLQRADVGIGGVTALAADPGALFLVSTRGVDRLITMTPTTHIAVVGIDELVPSYSDAFKVSEFLLRTIDRSPNLAVIGGPSKTGDIEMEITYGAHGPRELHVVLLDNGRMKAASDPVLREVLCCLKCGGIHSFTMWGIWDYITTGSKKLAHKCLEMGCSESCPLGIDLSRIVENIMEG